MVPIVEPEVLMDGAHTIERCDEVTGRVLHAVFAALFDQRVRAGRDAAQAEHGPRRARLPPSRRRVEKVATATLRTLARHVPPAVPGIVFLSGGQDHVQATEHLNAINRLEGPKPWKLSFSYGRALQDEALKAWQGEARTSPPASARSTTGPSATAPRRWARIAGAHGERSGFD